MAPNMKLCTVMSLAAVAMAGMDNVEKYLGDGALRGSDQYNITQTQLVKGIDATNLTDMVKNVAVGSTIVDLAIAVANNLTVHNDNPEHADSAVQAMAIAVHAHNGTMPRDGKKLACMAVFSGLDGAIVAKQRDFGSGACQGLSSKCLSALASNPSEDGSCEFPDPDELPECEDKMGFKEMSGMSLTIHNSAHPVHAQISSPEKLGSAELAADADAMATNVYMVLLAAADEAAKTSYSVSCLVAKKSPKDDEPQGNSGSGNGNGGSGNGNGGSDGGNGGSENGSGNGNGGEGAGTQVKAAFGAIFLTAAITLASAVF
jgi:uncharacterized membrane protein YgcG